MMRNLLRVDLTSKTIREEEIPPNLLLTFIGGKGLAAYYSYIEIPPRVDPLGADNKLMWFIGPLTGVLGVYTRHVLAAKSPLTETFCDSYAGGWFAAEFAQAGHMGLIVEGRAERPVYLKIDKDRISLDDASALVGKGCYEVDAMFPEYRVLSIGPAGENLVRFACVANECSESVRGGIAGRGGLGAVMGSKNLKAILVRGRHGPDEFIPEKYRTGIRSLRREFLKYLKSEVAPGMGMGGNLPAMQLTADSKVLPVRNFSEGFIEGYEQVAEGGFAKVKVGKSTCYLCPLACGVRIKADSGPFAGTELERIEYETVAMNGPNCQQLDIGTIAKVARLCNDYGMDTISLGNITGFLMECSARGLVDYRLEFGDGEGQVKLAGMIAHREGIGDLMAEGVMRAADKLGLQDYAVHIKGLEIPGYDVRGPVGMALAYATATVVTCLDGYQMTKKGRPGPALAIAARVSFMAGIVGSVLIAVLGPSIARLALGFGPAEYLGLGIFSLTAVSALAGKSLIKDASVTVVGMLLATVGIDMASSVPRFSFGSIALLQGFVIVSITIGLFGLGEVLSSLQEEVGILAGGKLGKLMPSKAELRAGLGAGVRGTAIAFPLGLFPGMIPSITTFIAYSLERQRSKYPEKFGTGVIEGVAAPEAANNAAAMANLVPLLALGVPTNATMAMILAALTMYGLIPGPLLFSQNGTFTWTVIGSFFVANVILVILNLPLVGFWARFATVPYPILTPIILAVCVIGTFSLRTSLGDIWLMLAFGVIGWVMRKGGWPPAPMVLGFVLGPMIEESARQVLSISPALPLAWIFTRSNGANNHASISAGVLAHELDGCAPACGRSRSIQICVLSRMVQWLFRISLL